MGKYNILINKKIKKSLPGYDVNGDGKVSVLEFKRIMLRSGNIIGVCGELYSNIIIILKGKVLMLKLRRCLKRLMWIMTGNWLRNYYQLNI